MERYIFLYQARFHRKWQDYEIVNCVVPSCTVDNYRLNHTIRGEWQKPPSARSQFGPNALYHIHHAHRFHV